MDDKAGIRDALVDVEMWVRGSPTLGASPRLSADHVVLALEVALAHARRWQRQEHDASAQKSGGTRPWTPKATRYRGGA